MQQDPKRHLDALFCLSDCTAAEARAALETVFAPDARMQFGAPWETGTGFGAWFDQALAPLYAALPDVERRPWLEMAGRDARGQMWVAHGGHYVGQFSAPFLGIPPTQRFAHMRFQEFFRLDAAGRVVELQALWDIPELMMQAGVWPMAPSLGREMFVPGPASQDGLGVTGDGSHALRIVGDMLTGLSRSPDGEAAMDLPRYWHPRCTWYGPAGIGTARGISGFRRHHQIPFLEAMPDRRGLIDQGHFFAEGNYVGFTAWPGMKMTLSGPNWLGLPATGQSLTMRSLDFWRVEGDLIRENWVLVDLIDVYQQLGIDVFARMKALM